jgi:hypothetical protein
MNLYQISNEYQTILGGLYDADTGEINEQAMAKLDDTGLALEKKIVAVASYIKNLEAEQNAINEARTAMAKREASLKGRVSYMERYLQSNMENCGIEKIDCPYFTIKLKKNPPKVNCLDETLVSDNYKKTVVTTTVSLDKRKMLEDMKNGVIIEGAALQQDKHLEIK